MSKKKNVNLTSLTVTVTPIKLVPSGSKNVQCNLGPPATGNVLFLTSNTEYNITFNFVPGNVPEVICFGQTKPFCNQQNNCPPRLPGGTVQIPCTVTDNGSGNGGASITIHVDARPNKEVTYYRLNFNDGYTWDPIIINN